MGLYRQVIGFVRKRPLSRISFNFYCSCGAEVDSSVPLSIYYTKKLLVLSGEVFGQDEEMTTGNEKCR